MSNRLKQITTKAKALYKSGKYAKWTDAIKAASATISKTTKKAVKKIGNVTLKKANYHKNDERYIIMNDGKPHLEGKPFFKNDALFVADALRKVKKKTKSAKSKLGAVKKAAPKKKAAVRNYGSHKDTASHNVKISVVSGIGNLLTHYKDAYGKLASKKLLEKTKRGKSKIAKEMTKVASKIKKLKNF
jgi:hypothetical protein